MYTAAVTFLAFVVAGWAPLVPYAAGVSATFQLSVVVTGVAFFVVGAGRSLVTNRRWYHAGAEMFAVGMLADVDAGQPVRADETLFRIGSISKLFAWTAVMRGIERGDLDSDVDVNRYLDAFSIPDSYDEPITLSHLATHTAGFEERLRGTFVTGRDQIEPLPEVLREERPSRVRPPGEFAAYSNYGAALAGHVAAKAGRSSFGDYVDESIFTPLGMDRSTFAQPVPEALRDSLSGGYVPEESGFRAGEFEYVGIPPAGSMSATATDMASFMRAHLRGGATDEGRILEPDSVDAMHRQWFTHDDRLNGMCFGFYEMSRNGVRAIGHGGDTQLFHSLLFLIPEQEVGVFVSYNSPGGVQAREDLVDAFFEQYYPADDATPEVPDESPARASDLTGTYRGIRMPYTTSEKVAGAVGTIDVSVDDEGRLVTSPLAGESQQWVQTDPLYFEEVGGEDALAFREDDGEITHLFLDSRPPVAYSAIPPHERSLVHGGVLAVSLIVFLTALIGWSGAAVWRRYRGRRRPASDSLARYGRWMAGAATGAFLAFVLIFVAVLVTGPIAFLVGNPLPFQLLLLLPAAGATATVATVGFAVLAWCNGYWGRWSRLHYSLVALAAVAVTLVLAYWNLLWYQM